MKFNFLSIFPCAPQKPGPAFEAVCILYAILCLSGKFPATPLFENLGSRHLYKLLLENVEIPPERESAEVLSLLQDLISKIEKHEPVTPCCSLSAGPGDGPVIRFEHMGTVKMCRFPSWDTLSTCIKKWANIAIWQQVHTEIAQKIYGLLHLLQNRGVRLGPSAGYSRRLGDKPGEWENVSVFNLGEACMIGFSVLANLCDFASALSAIEGAAKPISASAECQCGGLGMHSRPYKVVASDDF